MYIKTGIYTTLIIAHRLNTIENADEIIAKESYNEALDLLIKGQVEG